MVLSQEYLLRMGQDSKAVQLTLNIDTVVILLIPLNAMAIKVWLRLYVH